MADISQIKLPNNTTLDLKDAKKKGVYFVKGTQTAATGAWTGNIDIPELYTGLTIMYYLPYGGSGNASLNLTLSDGTTTGAKNCYITTSRLTTHYGAGRNILMTFYKAGDISISGKATTDDRWICDAYYDSNDHYYLRRSQSDILAGPNKIFPYTIIMQIADGRWESIVTSSSTGTSKARNTHGFRLGQILLMYVNATFNENARVDNYTIWDQHTGNIDHRYSFNTANNATSGTTANKPIYIVGALNATDGLFYLDTKWWTQTLPTADDGKLYIYIGDAYDYYRFDYVANHPIYWFKNGAIRLFAQDAATVTGHTVGSDVPSDAVFTDTKVYQTLNVNNSNHPILFSYANTSNATATVNNLAYRNNDIYANLSTGAITANHFNGYTIAGQANFDTIGQYATAEGRYNYATAEGAHAEGEGVTSSGVCSHAEGVTTTASGKGAHAEGTFNPDDQQIGPSATGAGSHAEGIGRVTASGLGAHAEGIATNAIGDGSHAEGIGTMAYTYQHVGGKYNIEHYAGKSFIIGNGTDNNNRSNCFTIDWDGNVKANTFMNIDLPDNAKTHRNIFRGKNLGTSITSDQYNAIYAGTFNDMYIGDYWEITEPASVSPTNPRTIKFYIADFDPFLGKGSQYDKTRNTSKHHIMLIPSRSIPKDPLTLIKPQDCSITVGGTEKGGYYNSVFRQNMSTVNTYLFGMFGEDHILKHEECIQDTKYASTYSFDYADAKNCIYANCTAELLSQNNVFGHRLVENGGNGLRFYLNDGFLERQVPIFRHLGFDEIIEDTYINSDTGTTRTCLRDNVQNYWVVYYFTKGFAQIQNSAASLFHPYFLLCKSNT